MQATERIYHLSHTDLDGYGAQYVVSKAFYNVAYFNSDYKDIDLTLATMLKQAKMESLTGRTLSLFLISDLNLTADQAKYLDKEIKKLPGDTQLLLLDHHATGAQTAEQYEWYRLETHQCATCITYDWVKQFLTAEHAELDAYLQAFSQMVNVTDLWLQEHADFERANFLSSMIFERSHMIPEMDEVARFFKFHMIEAVFKRYQQGQSLREAEAALHEIKEDFLRTQHMRADLVENPDLMLASKYYHLVFNFIKEAPIRTLNIDGMRAGIFYDWNHAVFQHVTSMLFNETQRVDIAIRVASAGKISMRSNDAEKHNVGALSAKYFGGGGHPCAAGGTLKNKRINSELEAVKAIEAMLELSDKEGCK
jgi:oligoribonuclease NrnB/cAMP/cGMP phosphodiesterase (DHH superfamily)